jgi:hypothetical protein
MMYVHKKKKKGFENCMRRKEGGKEGRKEGRREGGREGGREGLSCLYSQIGI